MENELEDWQLALLVDARKFNDPELVEAADAERLRTYRDLLEQADDPAIDIPVVVDLSVKQTHDKAEALLEAADGLDDWEIVPSAERAAEQEACAAFGEFLSNALKTHHGLRDGVVENMSVPAMVAQFRNDDDEIEFENLAQHPETGGVPEGDDAGDDGSDGDLDSLSAENRKLVKDKLSRAERMAERTPKFAETLRAEAAEIAGVDDYAAIDLEVL